MPRKTWVFDPGSGGVNISERVRIRTKERIRRYAEEHFSGKYTRLDVRFRGKFCYVDAYTEPEDSPDRPPPDWPETREEYLDRLRNTPTHLFRLRYYGDEDRWGLAFYLYSSDKYEMSVFPSGDFRGTPEEAFDTAARFHLA